MRDFAVFYNPSTESSKAQLSDFLKSNKWSIKQEFWDSLSEDDVIEVYDKRVVQIWTTLNFSEFCMWPENILRNKQVWELYERNAPDIDKLIGESIPQVYGGNLIKINSRSHIVRERREGARDIHIVVKFLAPIFDQDRKTVVATAAVSKLSWSPF